MLRRFEAEQEEVPGDRSKDSKKFFANIIEHPRNSGKKKIINFSIGIQKGCGQKDQKGNDRIGEK